MIITRNKESFIKKHNQHIKNINNETSLQRINILNCIKHNKEILKFYKDSDKRKQILKENIELYHRLKRCRMIPYLNPLVYETEKTMFINHLRKNICISEITDENIEKEVEFGFKGGTKQYTNNYFDLYNN